MGSWLPLFSVRKRGVREEKQAEAIKEAMRRTQVAVNYKEVSGAW
jgi:hypothetical protein